ncbi:MAG TPA: hypothetical protein VKZ89_14845 [Thermobifida alba]|nr:hypothetical protein [Thermobifida alba]
MTTLHETAETAVDLADVLLYTPGAPYPWQMAGAGTARMDDAEARVHLTALHGADPATAKAAMVIARVRETAAAAERLLPTVDCAQVRLEPSGAWMSRTEALKAMETDYRLTWAEAEDRLRLAAKSRASVWDVADPAPF